MEDKTRMSLLAVNLFRKRTALSKACHFEVQTDFAPGPYGLHKYICVTFVGCGDGARGCLNAFLSTVVSSRPSPAVLPRSC